MVVHLKLNLNCLVHLLVQINHWTLMLHIYYRKLQNEYTALFILLKLVFQFVTFRVFTVL